MTQSSPKQRKALGAFLASKRSQIKPGELGLPAGTRRTPGLRREEVAVLVGMSVSWYTWIEQGRDVRASAETLRRLAEVFRLDRVETEHLFALALQTPLPLPRAEEVSDSLKLLVRALDPIPAYVRNERFDILAWNAAVADLFVDYGALEPHERNTVRLMFLHPPYRSMILDWEDMARSYVASLRAAAAKAREKAPFDALSDELCERSAEFRAWWSEVNVTAFDEGHKRLRHPALGEVGYAYIAMTPEKQPNLSVVAYLLQSPARELQS